MPSSLVIIEFIDEAQKLLEIIQSNELQVDDLTIISPNPSTRSFLTERKIPCMDTLKFLPNDSHRNASKYMHHCLENIEAQVKLKDKHGITNSYKFTFIFYAQWAISYCLWIIEIIHNAFENNPKYQKLICLIPDNIFHRGEYLNDSERYFGILSKRYAIANNIAFLEYKYSSSFIDTHEEIPKKNKYMILVHQFFYKMVLKKISKKNILLLTTTGRNIDKISHDLKVKKNNFLTLYLRKLEKQPDDLHFSQLFKSSFLSFISFIFCSLNLEIPSFISNKRLSAIIDLAPLVYLNKNSSSFEGDLSQAIEQIKASVPLNYHGISFADLFYAKISEGIKIKILNLELITDALFSFMKRVKPECSLSVDNIGATASLGEISTKLALKSIIISHGSHPIPLDEISRIEFERLARGLFLTDHTYAAIQSKLAQKFATEFNMKSQQILTGPLTWGKLFQTDPDVLDKLSVPKNKKIILHAGTSKQRPSIRFFMYETLDEYIETIKNLIHAVSQMEGVFLIIKFRPRVNLSLADLTSALPNSPHYVISVEERFLDVLSKSDLLISYSSTTMEEAIENGVPVLQTGGRGRMKYLPGTDIIGDTRKLQRSPVYFLKDEDLLLPALEKILQHFHSKPLKDDELFEYKIPFEKRKALI